MRLAKIFLLISFIAAIPTRAQDKIELFGGYSYVRGSVEIQPTGPSSPCPPNCTPPPITSQSSNMNGWEASGTYKVAGPLGVVADVGAQYGNISGDSVHMHTFLFGPQLSLPRPVSPFVHALFGVAHESVGTVAFGFSSLGSSTAFATAIGGGIDVKAAPFVSIRVIQIDVLYTRLYGFGQSQPRVSAGLVFNF